MITETAPLPSSAIAGRGRPGTALVAALRRAGAPVTPIPGHDAAAGRVLPETLRGLDLLVLAVPDRAIRETAEGLSGPLAASGARPVVLHTSGAAGSRELEPLARLGLATGSCHPIQTFPRGAPRPDAFLGVTFGIEGHPEALRAAEALARTLGGRAVVVDASRKEIYHLAAVLAGNAAVGLLGAARDAMVAAGMTEREALDALAPLARAALEGALAAGPEGALTGPVARGDDETLERHRAALSAWDPSRLPLYDALVREQERLASRC